jgi:hypothetical protein
MVARKYLTKGREKGLEKGREEGKVAARRCLPSSNHVACAFPKRLARASSHAPTSSKPTRGSVRLPRLSTSCSEPTLTPPGCQRREDGRRIRRLEDRRAIKAMDNADHSLDGRGVKSSREFSSSQHVRVGESRLIRHCAVLWLYAALLFAHAITSPVVIERCPFPPIARIHRRRNGFRHSDFGADCCTERGTNTLSTCGRVAVEGTVRASFFCSPAAVRSLAGCSIGEPLRGLRRRVRCPTCSLPDVFVARRGGWSRWKPCRRTMAEAAPRKLTNPDSPAPCGRCQARGGAGWRRPPAFGRRRAATG